VLLTLQRLRCCQLNARIFTNQQSIDAVLSEDAASGGNPVAQIMYDAAMQRFDTPHVGVGLMAVIILGVFFCNVATMTYVSRYAVIGLHQWGYPACALQHICTVVAALNQVVRWLGGGSLAAYL
jgi:hypothetical protein